MFLLSVPKKVREKSREYHNHKPQPFPDPKRKRKPTNLNKHKPNKRTKSTKISSLFPNRGNRNTKRTEKHKNKMTHGKTYNKSPCRINHKATRSKTNTGTTALERPLEQTTGGFKTQGGSSVAICLGSCVFLLSFPRRFPCCNMSGFSCVFILGFPKQFVCCNMSRSVRVSTELSKIGKRKVQGLP